MHTSLPTDLWEHIASFCLDTHKLRTVCNVAQDLCAIQSICRSSSVCAADYWPSFVLLCQKPNRRIVREINSLPQLKYHLACQDIFVDHAVLAKAVKLPSDLLIVYLQVQTDKSITVTPWSAESTFQLTAIDLQNQLQPVNKVQMRQEHIKTKAGQSCSKTLAWVPIYSKQACVALQVYCELAVIRHTVIALQAVIALATHVWGSLAGLKHQAAVSKEARRKRKRAEEAIAKQALEARLSQVSATYARKQELLTLLSARGLHFALTADCAVLTSTMGWATPSRSLKPWWRWTGSSRIQTIQSKCGRSVTTPLESPAVCCSLVCRLPTDACDLLLVAVASHESCAVQSVLS